MGRKPGRKSLAEKVPVPVSPDHAILVQGIYRLEQVRAILGLRETTLPREIKAGRLRAYKRAARVFVLGRDLLHWLKGREWKPGKKKKVARMGIETT